MKDQFAYAYRYGHPEARGPEDTGGARKHPRAETGANSFRVFLTIGEEENFGSIR